MPWTDYIAAQVLRIAGVTKSPNSKIWNLIGASAVYNTGTKAWDITFSGGGLPEVDAGDNGSVLEVVSGAWAVVPGTDYAITTFTTTSTLVETGQSITPSFTAAHSRTPTSLVLTNNANGESKNVVGTPNNFSTSIAVVRNTPNQTYVYTLTGSDGFVGDVATLTITWGQRNFAGVATAAASLASIVAAATYTTLDTNGTFSFPATSAGGSERVCFAFPTRYGTPTVTDADTGLGVGITLIGTSAYVNAQGYSENYDRYSFDSAFIGTKNFNVAN